MNSNAFRKYLEEAFGSGRVGKILAALECPPSVSVRLNPAKWRGGGSGMTGIAGAKISGAVPWCGAGLFLESRPVFTLDPAMHSGAYYVQDSSSMFVGFMFRQVLGEMLRDMSWRTPEKISETADGGGTAIPQRPLRVLDLCAAPGGKTTDIASGLREMLGDGFLLVSNEVMKNRAGTLADNVALWGDPNVAVTSADPAAFAGLAGFFDIILADVPCSGEGMFRKDPEAAEQWSKETVELCAARQRRILADVWPALTPGGVLIYSTCTFNRMENDENVGWIAEELGAVVRNVECPFEGPLRTEYGFSLAPGYVRGEGQYCAALRKTGDGKLHASTADKLTEASGFRQESGRRHDKGKARQGGRSDKRESGASSFDGLPGMFSTEVSFKSRNEMIVAVPQRIEADLAAVEACLRPLMTGVAVGTMKSNRLIPSADLALSTILKESAFPDAPLDKKAALEFLHRDSIKLDDSPLGYVSVSYEGLRLGFVNNIGVRCNNLHPMSRRILMNLRGE